MGKTIFDVIDRVPEIRDSPHCISQFKLDDSIEFENVTFKYPTAPKEMRNTFDGVSFKIKVG